MPAGCIGGQAVLPADRAGERKAGKGAVRGHSEMEIRIICRRVKISEDAEKGLKIIRKSHTIVSTHICMLSLQRECAE